MNIILKTEQRKCIRSLNDDELHLLLFFLQTLDFSNCLISHIDRKAFSTLGNSVEAIVLKGNQLSSLQVIEVKAGKFSISYFLSTIIYPAQVPLYIYIHPS